ncbi:MAG: alpha/beta fold hydrolase [Oscillospiraceae bacterium]|nr:alpha/beta fold hydrolase [Oscillospiraceae bacterium]
MNKITGRFPSATELCDIRFYMYVPEKPKAVVQFSHGMCEFTERYEEFAQFLCENDIAFCGHDHVGHGSSVAHDDLLGYFGEQDGYKNMVRDLHRMNGIIRKTFSDIPIFLVGHSMGSFLSRIYLSKYEDRFNGAIIMGTAGGITGQAPLRKVLDTAVRRNGDLYRHKNITKMVYGVLNLRTANRRTEYDWLSRDDADVDGFIENPKCNFTFTVAGYRDMLNALLCCNSAAVIENTPTDIPLLFLSGGMDPIGEYGSGVRNAVIRYLEHGCDVNLRIYREARHELLFELNKNEVMNDILEFIIKRV